MIGTQNVIKGWVVTYCGLRGRDATHGKTDSCETVLSFTNVFVLTGLVRGFVETGTI